MRIPSVGTPAAKPQALPGPTLGQLRDALKIARANPRPISDTMTNADYLEQRIAEMEIEAGLREAPIPHPNERAQ